MNHKGRCIAQKKREFEAIATWSCPDNSLKLLFDLAPILDTNSDACGELR
ncbi:MAG: hypothetical protein PUP92_00665 [Rhizonema sp. PD38]|nr:hypothetical protein [Rhizonema sp. PD38]